MPNVNPEQFWQRVQHYFPGTVRMNNHMFPLEQSYEYGDLFIKFYPDSNTTTAAGIPCYTLFMERGNIRIKIRFCE